MATLCVGFIERGESVAVGVGISTTSASFVSAAQPCRHRQRQLLSMLEDADLVEQREVVRLIDETTCSSGHVLSWPMVREFLTVGSDHRASLGARGLDWLVDHGKPSPDWVAAAPSSSPPLRRWQIEALDAWADHGRQGVVQAVTGTGKSRVGIEAIRESLKDDYSVVVVVPTLDLVDQWQRALNKAEIHGVGVVGDSRAASFRAHEVVVGTIQSLHVNPLTRSDGKVLLVADECHRYGAGQWRRVLDMSYRRRLGLTATFERNDDGIGSLLAYFGGSPVYEIGFPDAIAQGVVAHYDVKLLGVELTGSERSDYDEADEACHDARLKLLSANFPVEPFGAFLQAVQQAAEEDDDPTITDVARLYLKSFSRRIDIMTGATAKFDAVEALASMVQASNGTLVFTRRVDVADEMAALLRDRGVKAESLHSDLSRQERTDRLAYLKVRRLKALVAPTVLDEGIDVPAVDLAIVLGGSRSRRQMIQRMGRALRLKPDGGKATFVVVYAKETAEDLTRVDGQEGCLDLIVEAADSVLPLGEHTPGEQVQTEPMLEQVESGGSEEVEWGGSGEAIEPAPALPPRTQLAAINAYRLPMIRHVLDAYRRRNGGGDVDADRALRALLLDMQRGADVRQSSKPGHLEVRKGGQLLVLSSTRFVHYARTVGPPTAGAPEGTRSHTAEVLGPKPERDNDQLRPAETLRAKLMVSAAASGGDPSGPADGVWAKEETLESAEPGGDDADPAVPLSNGHDDLTTQLERLIRMFEAGHLTSVEFAAAKSKIILGG